LEHAKLKMYYHILDMSYHKLKTYYHKILQQTPKKITKKIVNFIEIEYMNNMQLQSENIARGKLVNLIIAR